MDEETLTPVEQARRAAHQAKRDYDDFENRTFPAGIRVLCFLVLVLAAAGVYMAFTNGQ